VCFTDTKLKITAKYISTNTINRSIGSKKCVTRTTHSGMYVKNKTHKKLTPISAFPTLLFCSF